MARSSVNVDEEYFKSLRTKSYIDIWTKVHDRHHRPATTAAHEEDDEVVEETTTVSSHRSCYYDHLSDFLLEPKQETLLAATSTGLDDSSDHLHRVTTLLLDFFEITLQACTACATLLYSIDCVRSHHSSTRRLLLQLSDAPTATATFSELGPLLELPNPLSVQSLAYFHHTHELFGPLIERLGSAYRKTTRKAKLIRASKKAGGFALVAVCGIVTVGALALAAHAVAAIGAAVAFAPPVALLRPPKAMKRWVNRKMKCASEAYLKKVTAQLDAAAKGAYIIARDLDTMGCMVRRVEDEVEHGRDVAKMAVDNRKRHLVREVIKEMNAGEDAFVEQLEELEEHVYLCLLSINRSRQQVAQEMMMEAGTAMVPTPLTPTVATTV